jgi:hypothetical protein
MIHTNLDDSDEKYSFDRLALARYENLFRKTSELPDGWYPMTSDKRYCLNAEEALNLEIIDEVTATWPIEIDAGETD